MIIYTLFYLSTMVLSILGETLKKYHKIIWFILLLVIIFFSGLREDVGQDFEAYKRLYASETYHAFNFGGITLNLLIENMKSINLSFSAFVFLSSFLYFSSIGIFLTNFSKNKFLTLTIFILFPICFLSSFSGIRQTWALTFLIMSATGYLKSQKYVFISCAIISVLFHFTSLLFFLFLIVASRLRLLPMLLISTISCVIIWFYLEKFAYVAVVGGDYLTYSTVLPSLKDFILSVGLFISVILILLLMKHEMTFEDTFILKTALIGTVIVLFSKFSGVFSEPFMRLAIYFLWCYPILLGNAILRLKLPTHFRIFIYILVIIAFYFYSISTLMTSENMVPYKMVLF